MTLFVAITNAALAAINLYFYLRLGDAMNAAVALLGSLIALYLFMRASRE